MRTVLLSAVVLGCAVSATAQCDGSPDDATGPLVAETLPDSVLTYLERHQASPFVQAFLIAYVATSEPAAGLTRPSLARCATAFLDAGLDRPDLLAERLEHLHTDTLLTALRAAETARLNSVRDRQGLTGLVAYLDERRDVDEATFSGDVAFALGRLPEGADCEGPCAALRAALETVRSTTAALVQERAAREDAVEEHRGAQRALAAARASLRAACSAVPEDEVPCPVVDEAAACPDDHPALARCQAVARDRRAVAVADERQADAEREERTAREARNQATGELYRTLWAVRQELTDTPTAAVTLRASTTPPPSVGIDRRFQRPDREATPLAAEAAAPPPADLLLGLTDFVVDRARQETVYAFVQALYERMGPPPAAGGPPSDLQTMFRDTYQLMDALAVGAPAARRLPIRQAAQVPLATWRATLQADFETLPLRLGTDEGLALCPDSGCRSALATAAPLFRIGARVLDGEPVFAALVDAIKEPFSDAAASEDRREIAFALNIVAALIEVYRIQGQAAPGSASPLLLTPRTFGRSAQGTGDALLRVVLARAALGDGRPPLDVDPEAFEVAVLQSVNRIETLATLLRPAAEGERPSAAATLRAAMAVVESGLRVGRACGLDATRLERVERLWTEADQTVTALARREYGLALARSARLLTTLRGTENPLPSQATELLGLASALAAARTQSDVRVAFEAAASPVGGWEAKRYGRGLLNDGAGLTLTAYPGAGLGPEVLARDLGSLDDARDGLGLAVGVALPVGLHYSLTRGDDTSRDWSVGAFVPVLDLGALLSARLGDTAETTTNTSVQQVFAPGLFLTVGARSVPLTFTAGPQFVPNLRVTSDDEPAESVVQFRFGIGLDLVLFEF